MSTTGDHFLKEYHCKKLLTQCTGKYSSSHEDFQNVVAFLYYYNFFVFYFYFYFKSKFRTYKKGKKKGIQGDVFTRPCLM